MQGSINGAEAGVSFEAKSIGEDCDAVTRGRSICGLVAQRRRSEPATGPMRSSHIACCKGMLYAAKAGPSAPGAEPAMTTHEVRGIGGLGG